MFYLLQIIRTQKVHSLTRKAQEADTRQKYDLALSLYREAEGHFLNTLKCKKEIEITVFIGVDQHVE